MKCRIFIVILILSLFALLLIPVNSASAAEIIYYGHSYDATLYAWDDNYTIARDTMTILLM
jgi:hypothetical protein